jgi:glutathione S-transferase
MLKLVIANKNYSSWSLRPWVLMRATGIPFEEQQLSLGAPDFRVRVRTASAAGKVPVLIDDDLTVWDSLAIVEYLAERFPDAGIWPANVAARAHARSACAEMHSGFGALRSQMPMNVSAHLPGHGWNIAVQRDLDRICALWAGLRARHGADGPYLCGRFSAADAFFAPVVFRLNTYAPALPEAAHAYVTTLLALPAMREWAAAAAKEEEFLAEDEPYRAPPG